METTPKKENYYKVALLHLGEAEVDLVSERIFPANCYTPFVRYSLDIRDKIPQMINELRGVLVNPTPTINFGQYNFVKRYRGYKYDTEAKKLWVSKDKFFSLVFYMNDHKIVERDFYVSGYKPKNRFSLELHELMEDIVARVEEHIRQQDIDRSWGDYLLSTRLGYEPSRIHAMSENEREEILVELYKA